MPSKGFIFDLDGVLVDTAHYHYEAWTTISSQLGFDFTPEHNERLKGVSRARSLDILLEVGGVTASDTQKQHWMEEKNTLYLQSIDQMTADEILPNVRPVLEFLKQSGKKIALGSASKNAPKILEQVGLTSFFDAIIDGNQVQNAKPDPEVFLRAAKTISVEVTNCVVFEDAVAGIEAARAAGMKTVGIGDASVLHYADYVFTDFTQISTSFLTQL